MKFISYILVAAIAFGIAFFITNNKSGNEYDISGTNGTYIEETESSSYASYYSQLTDYEKSIYNVLLPTIENADTQVTLTNVNLTDFKRDCFTVTTAIQYDHPEYFWFTGGYSYQQSSGAFSSTGTIVFKPTYYSYVSAFFDADGKHKKLMSAVDNVAELAKKHSSDDYERIVFVHDYIIKNAIYDHAAVDEYFSTSRSPSCEYIFSAYGCLVNKKTVCSGYAKAFQLIMTKLGYDCTYVTGDAGEAHGWNCIYLDGEGYFVDVTWDDYDLEKEIPAYNYTFITGADLFKTHKITMEFDAPVCNATKYNYFIKRGYYSEKYDFSSASDILSSQSSNSAAYIKFGSVEELGKAYTDLIENAKYAQIPGCSVYTNVLTNKEHYTLTLLKQ